MKNLVLVFLLTLLSSVVFCQITTPRVFIKDYQFANDRIEIDYGFENCNPNDKYMVWIEASTAEGKSLNAKSFAGDTHSVTPISNHRLLWLTSRDSINLDNKIVIKLYATKQAEINVGKAYMFSTLLPGAGHKQVGGKNKLYLGVLGYGGIAGAVVFNGMAATALDNYAVEPDPSKSTSLMNDATKYRNLSLTCVGVSAGIWALDYYLLHRSLKKTKNLKPADIEFVPENKNMLSALSQTKYISTRGLPPSLFAELSFADANGNGILEANENAEVSITISNQGKGKAYNLNVNILDDKNDESFKIATIQSIQELQPNASKTISFPIKTDLDLKTAEHKLQINVTEKYGYDMDPAFLILQSMETKSSKLVFSGLEILDAGMGTAAISEDGQLQAGEMAKAKILVQNSGEGVANHVNFNVNTNDNNIFLRDNSGSLGTMNPGEVKEIYITISPNKRVSSTENLPIFLDLKENNPKGNLSAYQLPIKLNQKPPKTVIVTINPNVEQDIKNVARFEYSSKKFTANIGDVMNIKSVIPSQTKLKIQ